MTAYTPNLPALITSLPGDDTRAPQTEFTRARQVQFLENLSITGSVRSAASAAGVSHQTAYRARRATPAFRTAWDAALVVARAAAADTLACRAIDGIEEKVFYHGEEIATRTRYSDRLLLAHLARLDRLVENPRANAFAEDFDTALAAFERGEDFSSPGPCNTRSMSPGDRIDRDNEFEDELDDDYEDEDEYGDGIDWEDEEASAAEIARIEAAMEADRPADAPRLDADDPHGAISDAQFEAFQCKVPRWWMVLPPNPPVNGIWRYADEDSQPEAEPSGPRCEAEMASASEPASEAGARGELNQPAPAAF